MSSTESNENTATTPTTPTSRATGLTGGRCAHAVTEELAADVLAAAGEIGHRRAAPLGIGRELPEKTAVTRIDRRERCGMNDRIG